MKNFIFFIVIFVVLLLIGFSLISFVKNEKSKSQTLVAPATYEYYWSQTCPHCANVAKFMDSWEGRDKIQMEKFEVNESRDNAVKFYERGTLCNISKNELGVPLLVTPEGKCFMGDTPVIDYLSSLDL